MGSSTKTSSFEEGSPAFAAAAASKKLRALPWMPSFLQSSVYSSQSLETASASRVFERPSSSSPRRERTHASLRTSKESAFPTKAQEVTSQRKLLKASAILAGSLQKSTM